MRVHFLHPPDPEHLEFITSLLDPTIIVSSGEIRSEHKGTDLLVAGRPTPEDLRQLPGLKAVIVPWTGISPGTLAAVRKVPGLKLHNLHHNAVPTAELAIALLFSVAKKIIPFDQQLRQGNWEMRYQSPQSYLLAGKRALIVGYGRIGKEIAKNLKALDIEVKAIRRSIGKGSRFDVSPVDQLKKYLPQAEILVLAVPLTDETEGLIGAEQLALLPDNAILINISRGRVVDQQALYSALKDRKLFGAGLDVWYSYPTDEPSRKNTLPGDYPFHELDNIVISPHRAGLVKETEILRMKALAELLNQAVKAHPMDNRVDLDLGY